MFSTGRLSPKTVFCNALTESDGANFKVIFWDKSESEFGNGKDFILHLKNEEVLKKVLFNAPLGFGEGYMNGDIEVEGDIREVVKIGYLCNRLQIGKKRFLFDIFNRVALQRNGTKADMQNIAYHYDIGNDFYQLWLDPEMVYSCAYFKNQKDSLEMAQLQKINLCCRKLQLQPNESLLDIGCGWGSLLINAAKNFGIRGVGITLSKQQLEYGKQKVQKEGLQDRVHLEYLDYRDLPQMNQTFDKVISVGMFEHVGKANMHKFLENTRTVLRPNGLLLLHTIGKTVEGPTNSWIKKHIFPGCYLPDLGSILKNSTSLGLNFVDCENMRIHYSKTLDHWSQRFEENEAKIRSMFDDRFVRMWRFYLAGCSAVFRLGTVHLFQLLFSAGVRNDLPLTREWMLATTSPQARAD